MLPALRLLLPLMLLLGSQFLHGQSNFRFMRLGVNEGLSQNSVREIFQDRQGFIWIGTGDGLNRYDGKQIKKYRKSLRDNSPKRFPGKIINGNIRQDKEGNLWMIVDGQLVKMNLSTEKFTVIKSFGGDLIHRIIGLQDSLAYITNASDVNMVNIFDSSVVNIPLPSAFAHYTNSGNESFLLYNKAGAIYRYNTRTGTSELLFHAAQGQIHSAKLSNASILFTAGNKVFDYDLTKGKVIRDYTITDTVKYNSLSPLLKTPGGDIVLSVSKGGFVLIDDATGSFFNFTNIENEPASLSSNYIYTAITDHTDNMWLGTEGGGISILNLKPQLFDCFPDAVITKRESSLLMVKSIYHSNDKIYIGTYSKGLYEIDRNTLQQKVFFEQDNTPDAAFNGIFFIKPDDKERIWMNNGSRVGVVDLDRGKFQTSVTIDYARKGNWHNIPQCFAQVSPCSYLVGTVQSTYLVQEKENKLTVTDLGLLDHQLEGDIQTIFKKENGDIIIGKGEGDGYVVISINENSQPTIKEKRLTGVSVKHIYRDDLRKAFWMATNVGIVIQKDGDQNQGLIDEENGLSNDFIYSIIAENDYTFWVSTNKGINRILLKQDGSSDIASVEQYTIQHGLQSNEFNTGAFFKDSHTIFFGGVTGVNWFDYRKFHQRSFSPRSYITNLEVNDKPLATDSATNFLKSVQLSYHENNLLIQFATLDFTNPAVNHYQYRLAGYDNTWIDANNNPEARYSQLPHGQYSFEIKSSNSEGVWSSAMHLLSITITPPFWLTWWFRIGAGITALVLLFLLSRYFVKRKMQKQLRLIQQELAINNERLRISRDMHDELGTGLSKIALLSEVGKTDQQSKGNKIINEINDTSRKLADKMGEIIWTLNPHNDTLGNLAAYLKEYVYETTESLPIHVQVNFPESIPEISIGHTVRQQLMLVTKEAINNALKHANASQINFSLSLKHGYISFTIKDNGKGFGRQVPGQERNGKKNGLVNMNTRMKSIGGHFTINSSPGAGTEIGYGVPV